MAEPHESLGRGRKGNAKHFRFLTYEERIKLRQSRFPHVWLRNESLEEFDNLRTSTFSIRVGLC